MKTSPLLLALSILIFPIKLLADLPSGYLGIQGAQLTNKSDSELLGFNGGDDFETSDVFLRLGGRITPWFASELRLGTTVDDFSDGGETYRYDFHAGAFVRLDYNWWQLTPYLIGGLTSGQRELDSLGSESFVSYSYGAGLEIDVYANWGLQLEYMQLYAGEDFEPEMLSAGIYFRFQ